jgi:von Willebrand factor type A domain
VKTALRRALLVPVAAMALPWLLSTPVAAAGGSTTVLVLDVSGSMDEPARIPPDFPQAAKLQQEQDALGRLVEQAKPGHKVPLSVIAGGLMGLPDLIQLQSQLDTYLQQHNVDPSSISKLAALKVAATQLLTAVQLERDHTGADDRVGIVTFSDDSTVLAPVTPAVSGLAAAVQGLRTEGSTNMGAGLASALDLLQGQPGASIIMLTDGWNNTGMTNDEVLSGPVQRAAAGKVPICTIGLGETPADVDQQLLLDIASRTGGGYRYVDGTSPLGGDLLACQQSLSGELLADQRGTVVQGQVAAGPGFTVPAGRHRLSVTLSWPGSQLDLRMTDPAGRPVGQGYPGASITRGAGLDVLTVANPAAGHWGMAVAGVQTAAAGDPFVATAATEGTTGAPHRDAVQGSGAAPLDETQQRLLLARNVSAVVAGALIVLWFLGLITRPFRRRRRPVVTTVVVPPGPPPGAYGPQQPVQPWQPPTAYQPPQQPAQGALGPGYTPPPPSGYVPGAGQQQYYGAPVPPVPPVPPVATAQPTTSTRSGGCLGCLGWLVFVVDVLVLGASAAALYLWSTPLLTFPG